jgi:mono/diheme cytochrome c family protein
MVAAPQIINSMQKLLFPLLISAGFSMIASADDDDTAKAMEAGKTSFMMCAACHGMDGKGVQAGPSKMAPALIDSKVALGDPSVMALVMLKGIQKEGTEYLGMMAPLGAALDDEKLAAVMTYVRGSFGNKAAAVTKEDAAKYREQWKDITAPVSRAKIAELSTKK